MNNYSFFKEEPLGYNWRDVEAGAEAEVMLVGGYADQLT